MFVLILIVYNEIDASFILPICAAPGMAVEGVNIDQCRLQLH